MGQSATLVIVGGGNMGVALAQGLLRAGRSASDIVICEVNRDRQATLSAMIQGVQISENIPPCRDAVIAVKPGDVDTAIRDAVAAGAVRLVSIAAGVRLAALQRASGNDVRVVRAMPNTPATVGLAATAFAVSSTCTTEDRDWAFELLSSIGLVIEVDEARLDAFTGVVGSGPAYVFYLAEALRDAAIAEGFDADTSAALVARVLVGSAALLEREPSLATELRSRVTSPNGTTAAGVAQLEQRNVREAVAAAVRAAVKRSKELGNA